MKKTKLIPYFAQCKKNIEISQFEFVSHGPFDVCGGIGNRCLIAGSDIIITIGTTEVVDNQLPLTMIFSWPWFGPLVFGLLQMFSEPVVCTCGFWPCLFGVASFICV
jgi:DHA1 family bicyclomycin/chloramphenicol resistance-like MFS transporter